MIKIIKSKKYAGYWVNGKYILPENFEISKNKLTEAEQQQFLKTTDQQQINNSMQQQEINIQKNIIAQYETAGNSIGVAFHKAILKKLVNSITVIQPVTVGY